LCFAALGHAVEDGALGGLDGIERIVECVAAKPRHAAQVGQGRGVVQAGGAVDSNAPLSLQRAPAAPRGDVAGPQVDLDRRRCCQRGQLLLEQAARFVLVLRCDCTGEVR
jgi:hypothetical protein